MKKRASFLLLLPVLLYWVAFVCWVLFLFVRGQSSDFSTYYAAAPALRQQPSANIYDTSFLEQVMRSQGCADTFGPYAYPQTFAILLQPLTLLPCNLAASLWWLMNVCLWLASALLLARWVRNRVPDRPWLSHVALLLCLISVPGIESLALGQVNFVVLFGLALVPWLLQREKPLLAGGVLALLALIKVLPALLLVYYAARGRWLVVLGAGVAGALLLGVTMLAVGLPSTMAALVHLFSWGLAEDPRHNEALAQLPLWLTVASGGQPDATTRPLMQLAQGAVGLAFAGGLFMGWLRKAGQDETLGYGWAICVMLLLAPLAWFLYLLWLLVPICYVLGIVGALPRRQQVIWLLLLAGVILLTAFPLPLNVDNLGMAAPTPRWWGIPLWLVLLLSRPLGTLLLGGILYRLWWMAPAAVSKARPSPQAVGAAYGAEGID